MKYFALALSAATLSLSLALHAGVAKPSTFMPSADAASRDFDDAQFHGDVSTLERLLAPDFLYVRGSGHIAGRREFIAGFTDPTQHLDPFVITDRRIISLGPDAVVIAADGVISGVTAGKRFREHFRYADTFVRRGRRWLVAYVQVTPIAP